MNYKLVDVRRIFSVHGSSARHASLGASQGCRFAAAGPSNNVRQVLISRCDKNMFHIILISCLGSPGFVVKTDRET